MPKILPIKAKNTKFISILYVTFGHHLINNTQKDFK